MPNLKAMREAKGLSQSQLANITNISFRTIQSYERCASDINGAKLKTLAKLSIVLGCSISDILELENDEELEKLLEKVTL